MPWIAFTRCYELGSQPQAKTTEIPRWYSDQHQHAFLATSAPLLISVPGQVTRADNKQLIERYVIHHTARNLLEIILYIPSQDLRSEMHEGAVKVAMASTQPWEAAKVDISPEATPQWVCDMTYLDVTGVRPKKPFPMTTGLNAVALAGPGQWDPGTLPKSMEVRLPELDGNEPVTMEMSMHLNVVITVDTDVDDINNIYRLIVVGARINRSRHLEKRVLGALDVAMHKVESPRNSPWNVVGHVAALQREAINYRAAIGSVRTYTSEATKQLHDAWQETAGMSARNVDLLEAQISSFDSLVQSYVGLGV